MVLKSFSENPGNSECLSEQTQFYREKIKVFIIIKCKNFKKNFREISGKFPKFRKFAKNFPGNFPKNSRKFPGKSRWPYNRMQRYRAKIYLFMTMKDVNVHENFGKISGKISEMSKTPGRNFSGKFPGNSGCFFRVNTMIQSVNLFFYV